MEALELLLTRTSQARLVEPAPSGEALNNILNAGLRAPDHANLSPFRFIVCQNDGRQKLADIYTKAALASKMEPSKVEKAKTMAYRAPMVIVAICEYKPHDKVPRIEQIATTACAIQNMQMAAFAQGFNGMWRTGSFASNELVRDAFNLKGEDEIVGFLYLGTPSSATPIKRQKAIDDYVEVWN